MKMIRSKWYQNTWLLKYYVVSLIIYLHHIYNLFSYLRVSGLLLFEKSLCWVICFVLNVLYYVNLMGKFEKYDICWNFYIK